LCQHILALLGDLHEPFRPRHGIQQRRVGNAEDRRVRSNAKRKGEHGYGGEAGVLQQLAEGEFEIIHGARPSSDGANVAVCRSS